MNNGWFALGLTLLAGMATGIGSIITFTAGRTNYRFLSVATGFSVDVIRFIEIFAKGGQRCPRGTGRSGGCAPRTTTCIQ